jgi:diketogulonate reductase-like aldo/keto reductase
MKEGLSLTEAMSGNYITLSNGVKMPQLGLGVFQAGRGRATEIAVNSALKLGYRSIDTASVYGNEREVGNAIRESGIPRDEIFITGKVWNDDIRNGLTMESFENTLWNLQTDYLDLYLLHWPVEGTSQAWSVLEKLYAEGRVRAIGVSNFQRHHIEDMAQYANVMPMLNQIESHPVMNNQKLIDWCRANGIAVGAWSPLGGPRVPLLQHPVLVQLAEKYHRSPAQIVLRWDIQRGIAVTPKSSHPERIAENSQIFDFQIADEDVKLIQSLNMDYRLGPDPDDFNF